MNRMEHVLPAPSSPSSTESAYVPGDLCRRDESDEMAAVSEKRFRLVNPLHRICIYLCESLRVPCVLCVGKGVNAEAAEERRERGVER